MLQGARALRLNEPRASATSEGFPVREYFHVSSLNSKWVEIVSKATQMYNGLKSFLKAQFKAFKIVRLKKLFAVNESLLQHKAQTQCIELWPNYPSFFRTFRDPLLVISKTK